MTATTTAHTPAQIAGIKRSKKFRALTANGFSEAEALSVLGVSQPEPDPAAEKVAALVATGSFTEAEARNIVEAQFFTPTATATATKPQVTLTKESSKDVADRLVAERGLAHTRGRVYVTGEILEAAARVLRKGKPEIVNTSGVGRTTAVVIFREDSGDVAIQNLYQP